MNYYQIERIIYFSIMGIASLSIIVAGSIRLAIFIGERKTRDKE